MLLAARRKPIAGSPVGSQAEAKSAQDACAAHNIQAGIEMAGAKEVQAAMSGVMSKVVCHRLVIDIGTLALVHLAGPEFITGVAQPAFRSHRPREIRTSWDLSPSSATWRA